MNVCYTANIDNYDILRPPFKSKDWKFICFTTLDINSNGWELIKVNRTDNKIKQARCLKILPAFDFPIERFLWVDANIEIIGDLNQFIEPLQNYDLSLMSHPHRQTLQQEIAAIIKYRKDKESIVRKQLLKYRIEGYHCNELAATGIVLRKYNQLVINQAHIWKNEVISNSHRDQMSFNYSCWKSKLKPHYFPYNEINGQFFKYHLHPHKIK